MVPVRHIAWILGLIILCLVLLSAAGDVLRYWVGYDNTNWFVRKFNLDLEGELSTWYSAFTLVWCVALLLVAAWSSRAKDIWRMAGWLGLAVIFAFLSADEALGFHERLILPLRAALDPHPIFFFAWVIPYMVAVLVIGLIYLKFLWSLEKRIRWAIIAAGFAFVTGAIGMELIGGYLLSGGDAGVMPIYALITTVEEALEMIGIAIFICALLAYLSVPSVSGRSKI